MGCGSVSEEGGSVLFTLGDGPIFGDLGIDFYFFIPLTSPDSTDKFS